MKKYSLIISSLVLIVIAACTSLKEESIGMEVFAGAVFYASIETPADSASTKVYADDKLRVLWNADDRVSIFNKYTYNQEYQFTGEDGDNSGAFKKVPNDDFVTGNELDYVYAVYPYAESSKISNDGVLTLTFPAEQSYKEASFGIGANTMVSVTENNNLQFKNAGGYISFKFYGNDVSVSRIEFKGNNGEKLVGKATVTMASGGIPSVEMQETATGTLTLTCANPVTLGTTKETASEFWLVIPPTNFSQGFTVTIMDPDGRTYTKSTSGSLTVRRNGLTHMSALEVTLSPYPPFEIITFADPIAKSACVEKFDTNGDGEVSYGEAAAVTSLSGLFTNWNEVTNFDEIKYFTGVTSTVGVFTGLSKLESITIPDNITTLGTFRNCISLKKVVLPQALTSLPDYCFDGCYFLTGIVLPSGITAIGDYAFSNSGLTSLNFPPNVIIGEYAFNYCESLESVVLPSGMTTIPNGMFAGSSALRKITWPDALETIGYRAFNGCGFKDADYTLELPPTVKSIGSCAFESLPHLIIPSTSAASIQSDSFGKNYTFIYVPSSMVEMYKVSTNWSEYADFIRPISDYPLGEYPTPIGSIGEAVDLGLSVKWASWNVGASSPEEYGAYFAWGETDGKWDYDWSTYKFRDVSSGTMTKYNTKVDNKTTLEPEDDAAHVKWGGSWRMPTYAEWGELIYNCTCTWTSDYNGTGVAGRIVTSNKAGYTDKSIFLPAAGVRSGTSLNNAGSRGSYWSSSLKTDNSSLPRYVIVSSSVWSGAWGIGPSRGFSVRPVTE